MEDDFDGSSASKVKKIFKKLVTERRIPASSATLDDDFYPLDKNKKMGTCVIFNHKIYECGAKERKGTDLDKDCLKEFFEKYGFDVEEYTDKKAEKISQILSKIAERKDLKKTCCFVCCVLTHGDIMYNTEVLYATDAFYPTEKLFTPFLDCSALLNKPKLFFIQACRGDKYTEGMDIYFKHSAGSLLPVVFGKSKIEYEQVLMCTMPKEADFLIAHSTVPGHLSWKNTINGSRFIQELCTALNESADELDLESILTIVRRRVALNYPIKPGDTMFEQKITKGIEMNQRKQIPSLYTTLTRKFMFPSIN